MTYHDHSKTTRFDTSDTLSSTHFPPCLSRNHTCVSDLDCTVACTQRAFALPHFRFACFPCTVGGAGGTNRYVTRTLGGWGTAARTDHAPLATQPPCPIARSCPHDTALPSRAHASHSRGGGAEDRHEPVPLRNLGHTRTMRCDAPIPTHPTPMRQLHRYAMPREQQPPPLGLAHVPMARKPHGIRAPTIRIDMLRIPKIPRCIPMLGVMPGAAGEVSSRAMEPTHMRTNEGAWKQRDKISAENTASIRVRRSPAT
jgi:hypothetical protein